uniref:Uncharacterized protein n=1 Tax=Romanomermis culicivorax TaxID=13658 RepID=A0A915JWH8_ROMCU
MVSIPTNRCCSSTRVAARKFTSKTTTFPDVECARQIFTETNVRRLGKVDPARRVRFGGARRIQRPLSPIGRTAGRRGRASRKVEKRDLERCQNINNENKTSDHETLLTHGIPDDSAKIQNDKTSKANIQIVQLILFIIKNRYNTITQCAIANSCQQL